VIKVQRPLSRSSSGAATRAVSSSPSAWRRAQALGVSFHRR